MAEPKKTITIPWSSKKSSNSTIFSKFWKWISTPQTYGTTPYGTSYKIYGASPKKSVTETPVSEGLMYGNDAVSEGLMRDNTAISQTFDSPNPTETRSLEDIINGVKNPFETNELPVIGKD